MRKGSFTPNKICYQDYLLTKFLIESSKYGNKEVIIDTEDWDRVKQRRWGIHFDPTIDNFYVLWHNSNKEWTSLHNFILNNKWIDHINHNTLDNRKINLRICNNIQNKQNSRIYRNNTSGYKGVTWHKPSSKWISHITINKKYMHLGYFKDKIDAAKVYNEMAIKYFGEFAQLNQI